MKKTSGALLTSVLALTLCLVMLLGTTWAWFTDEVTSAGNIIQAGTLKIDLEHLTDPANDTWTSIKDTPDHKVFDYKLWEPGYTQYETLRITNEDSTLALKFRLNAVAANAVLGDKGENLADVIDVYVANGVVAKPANFDAILADSNWRNAGTLASLMQDPDGVAYGIIVPNWDHDYNLTTAEKAITVEKKVEMTFALHMREEAGNEYQGLSVGDIALNLFATQYTYEDDSFDDLYDDGLELIEDGVLTEENGVQYIDTGDEVYLYLVTDGFVGDTVDVPANVTKIGNYAFAYNSNVKTVNVPGTVKDLGRGFDSSNVETVILGEGIETISNRAFGRRQISRR